PPPPANAIEAGVRPGPALIGLDADDANRVWHAFLSSCHSLLARQDTSGLTRPEDWRAACGRQDVIEVGGDPEVALENMRSRFELVQIGDGVAFATGYYEPEIRGCRTPEPGCEVPIY